MTTTPIFELIFIIMEYPGPNSDIDPDGPLIRIGRPAAIHFIVIHCIPQYGSVEDALAIDSPESLTYTSTSRT